MLDRQAFPTRRPAAECFDALVELLPLRDAVRTHAAVLVKQAWALERGELVPAPAEALTGDFRGLRAAPAHLPSRSDFWFRKPAVDVLVMGSAFGELGRRVTRTRVSAAVGTAQKDIEVFGRRWLDWGAGKRPRFTDPEPFDEMPLVAANAYGGIDPRVPDLDSSRFLRIENALYGGDHPGMYPRNPFGKGYLVAPAPGSDVELPNLEHPLDLLSPERVVVEPASWFRQPLPWHLGIVELSAFPRCSRLLGVAPWFPPPDDDDLAEVRDGYLPPGFHSKFADRVDESIAQEAPYGLIFPEIPAGTPITVTGMHREEASIAFRVPAAPSLELLVDSRRLSLPAQLHTVLVRPSEKRVLLTYGAVLELPRYFIPGVHKRIPVAVSVDETNTVSYDVPPRMNGDVVVRSPA